MIERADKALYQAKKSGKNRVTSELDLVEEAVVMADPVPWQMAVALSWANFAGFLVISPLESQRV